MVATRTNERPGTRAQVRHVRMSATKAREVLDLIRGLPVGEAAEVLQFTERGASVVVGKCLASAIANAQHNDELDVDTLYVSACYADEGPTLKRWRPRARGRATRIRKRMCHITILVSPMPAEMAAKVEARQAAGAAQAPSARRGRRGGESRRARVARSRGESVTAETEAPAEPEPADEVLEDEMLEDEVVEDEPTTGEPTDEMVEDAEEEALADEAEDDESPAEDESTEQGGVDSAVGGDAEGGASTEAENDSTDTDADEDPEEKS
jgi:large subunit ribosomal protein L22